jgi:GLPGLI family protein
MKKIPALATTLTILFLKLSATAQESEPALFAVTYEFTHVNDINHRENPIREDMVLCLGPNSSKYTNRINEDRQRKVFKAIKMMPPVPPPIPTDGSVKVRMGRPIAVVYGRGFTQETLFQHTKENKLNKTAVLGTVIYLIESPLPRINWKMDKETRNIGGYTCQKAVGNYAGRTYTAWFTTELPFRNGPWKLNGLPGLILEASDASNEVSFRFKELSKDTVDRMTGTTDKELVKVSDKAYERACEAWLNDPQGIVMSQRPAGTPELSSVPLGYVDSTGKLNMGENAKVLLEKFRKETVAATNNPLELSKK